MSLVQALRQTDLPPFRVCTLRFGFRHWQALCTRLAKGQRRKDPFCQAYLSSFRRSFFDSGTVYSGTAGLFHKTTAVSTYIDRSGSAIEDIGRFVDMHAGFPIADMFEP
jgi:hypothetical protein